MRAKVRKSNPVVEKLPKQLYTKTSGPRTMKMVAEKHAWANIKNADLEDRPCAHSAYRIANGCENALDELCSCPPTCVCWEPIHVSRV